jgi:hypothetical protein
VEVIKIDHHAIIHDGSHEGESLGSETIRSRGIRAGVPLHAGEVNPVEVGDRVETGTEERTSRSGCAVWMIIRGIDTGMVIEILRFALTIKVIWVFWIPMSTHLLHVDHIIIILGKVGTDGRSVGGLVSWHVVAIEDSW